MREISRSSSQIEDSFVTTETDATMICDFAKNRLISNSNNQTRRGYDKKYSRKKRIINCKQIQGTGRDFLISIVI